MRPSFAGGLTERRGNLVDVVDAAGPGASAGSLEHGPQARIRGHFGVAVEGLFGGSFGEDFGSGFGGEPLGRGADVIERAGQVAGVDDDFDQVAVAELADGASIEGFGADVTDAGSGGDAREPGVRDQGDVLAEGEVPQGRRDLIGLFHAAAEGATTHQDDDVTFFDGTVGTAFHCGDGVSFRREDSGGAELAVDAVGVDDGLVDRGALDDRAFGSDVAQGERDGAGEAAFFGGGGRHHHGVGVHAVSRDEELSQADAAFGLFPPFQDIAKRLAGDGEGVELEQAERSQMQHQFGDATGEEEADCRVTDGAVRQAVDQSRNLAVDAAPVVDRGASEAGFEGEGGDVQQQVGRATAGGVDHHCVVDGVLSQHVFHRLAAALQFDDGSGGAAGGVQPDWLTGGCER
ncbi:MAG: hypothetical protein JWP89_7008 [Schlesneria sp.]|nr:hypothetical protein [Schlesneria sp.]